MEFLRLRAGLLPSLCLSCRRQQWRVLVAWEELGPSLRAVSSAKHPPTSLGWYEDKQFTPWEGAARGPSIGEAHVSTWVLR